MNLLKYSLSALLALSMTASVLNADEEFVYAGVGAGYSLFNANFLDSDYYLVDDQVASAYKHKNYNEDSIGFKAYGGYRFNNIIAVEASFTDYGTISSKNYTQNPQALALYANAGYAFLDNQLRPFGILGLSYLQTNQSYNLLDDDFVAIHAGLGLEYYPKGLKGFGMRAAFESDLHVSSQYATNASETHYSSQSFWKRYMLFYVGAQYKF